MSKRVKIVIGMALAMLWSVTLVWWPQTMSPPFMPLNTVMIMALLPGGLIMLLLLGRLAQRRFFDDETIDGATFAPGSGGEIDQRVLTNTTEQLLLAIVLWPFVALTLGGLVALFLGVGFGIARLAFWLGYHISAPLRAFGFGATFYPTVLATVWAVLKWAT
jgi:hypothetical protein